MSLILDHKQIQLDAFLILNALPGNHLILLPNTEHTIAAVTDSYLKATFTIRENIIGKGLFEVFPDNPSLPEATGVKNLRASLNEVLQKKVPHRMEDQRYDVLNAQTNQFEFKIWQAINYPVLTEDGNVSYIIHTVNDITEKIQLENAGLKIKKELKRQREVTDTILDASLNGIYAIQAMRDMEGNIIDFRYLFANKSTAQYLGMEPKDILGLRMLDLIPENKSNGFFDYFCEVLEKGTPVHDETFFRSSKFTGWFDFTVMPIEEETLIVTIHDITEQKKQIEKIEQNQTLLNNILKYSPSGIMVTKAIRNEKGEVTYAKVILANAITEQYIGIPFLQIKEKKDSEINLKSLKSETFQEALCRLHAEVPFTTQFYAELTRKWLEISVAPIDENHMISVLTDVTLIKEAQIQMEKSIDTLRLTNQNLQQFAYSASHDLKEPIRKIHYFSDKLNEELKNQLNENQLRLFIRMEQATVRMEKLIDDLLNYSLVSQSAVHMEDLDLNEIITQTLEDFELEIEKKQAKVFVEQLPVIKGNKHQMEQLFQNLLSNSLKYHNEKIPLIITVRSRKLKGIDIEMPLIQNKEETNYHLIEFIDNGIGFDQLDAERIFQVFTRLHGNAEYSGTGVGLSIAQKVVENHHGIIRAESTLGYGAKFKIFLPIYS